MEKIFVIAGTNDQYIEYRRRKIEELTNAGFIDFRYSDIVYVRSPSALIGVSDPAGVFIGTWRERLDLGPVFEQLLIASRDQHKANIIRSLFKEWQALHPKPKPKTAQQVADEAIGFAAKELSDAIDAEVMAKVMATSTMQTVEYSQIVNVLMKGIEELQHERNNLTQKGSS